MSTAVLINGVALPDGWTTEDWSGATAVVRPGVGAVTIDFDRRCYWLGWTTIGRPASQHRLYIGRAWRKALVADAVTCLSGVGDRRKGIR